MFAPHDIESISLKSNMDRFIDHFQSVNLLSHIGLKSNMDRFIELKVARQLLTKKSLKSNMDRFIDSSNEVGELFRNV